MGGEELKLLDKIEELPKELNIEIRGLILSEVCLRKENQQLKEQLNKKYENVGTLTSEILYEENTKLVQENQQLKEKLEASERARKEGIELVNELADETDDTTCYEINKKRKEMIIDILDIDKGE